MGNDHGGNTGIIAPEEMQHGHKRITKSKLTPWLPSVDTAREHGLWTWSEELGGQCFFPLRCCTMVHMGEGGVDVEGIPDNPTAPPAAEAGRVTTAEEATGSSGFK